MKKIIFSFIFLVATFLPLFAAPSYFIYDRPADYTEEEAQNLMLEENKFTLNGQAIVSDSYKADSSQDSYARYGPKVLLRFRDEPVFRGVPIRCTPDSGCLAAKDVFLIDGPANIRITPGKPKKEKPFYNENGWKNPKEWDGKVIGEIADNTMVFAAQKYGDWYFIYDRSNNTGWTNKQNLKPIAADKLYFFNKINNAPEYFASWKEETNEKISEIFEILEPNTALSKGLNRSLTMDDMCFGNCNVKLRNIYLPEGKTLKDLCPKFITPFEKDGFVSTVIPFDTSAKKSYIWRYCNGQSPYKYVSPSTKIADVKMKTDRCVCIEGSSWDGYSAKEFYKNEFFGNDCTEKDNTIVCELECKWVDSKTCSYCDSYEVCESGGPIKICPKECMQWQPVSEEAQEPAPIQGTILDNKLIIEKNN